MCNIELASQRDEDTADDAVGIKRGNKLEKYCVTIQVYYNAYKEDIHILILM